MQSMRASPPCTRAQRILLQLAVLVAAVFAATPIGAQQLRGVVRDSASGLPIPGAVIVLLDSGGNALGRNITNERGQYVIVLHSAMRRVQVLRIGFRPRTARIPQPVDGVAQLDVVMPAIPTLLESVSVVDQPNCPRRDDRPAAFALWEQAKAALLATVVARETNPADVVRLRYIRRMNRDDQITSQNVWIDSASTSRPFVATRTAADFVERGFAYDSAHVTWFNGPDADVMLDDAFARGYCFQIAASERERPNQVGLAFGPSNRKRGRIDIEGAVWIDSTTRALTDIVFHYLGVDAQTERIHP
ncbi:MAG: carboxypeptidase-like regulatory domain-containing protein, partial [bacterium]